MKYFLLSSLCVAMVIHAGDCERNPVEKSHCPYKLPVNKAIYFDTQDTLYTLIETFHEDCHTPDVHDRSPLHVALLHSPDEQVPTYLVELNTVNIEAVDDEGNTALHVAVRHQKTLKFLTLLLSCKKIAIDAVNNRQRTAFHEALAVGSDNDILSLLVQHGANTDHHDEHNTSPLFRAIRSHDIPLFQTLLPFSGKTTYKDEHNHNILHHALIYAQNEKTIEHLLDHNTTTQLINFYDQDADGRTPIHTLMMQARHKTPLVERIINESPTDCLTIEDAEGHAPIHTAVLHNFLHGIKALVKAGVSIEQPNREGKTPLLLTLEIGAGGVGSQLIRPMVIDSGANPNRKNNEGHTPLHSAALAHKPEHMKQLILSGAVKSETDNTGKTIKESLESLQPGHIYYTQELAVLKNF